MMRLRTDACFMLSRVYMHTHYTNISTHMYVFLPVYSLIYTLYIYLHQRIYIYVYIHTQEGNRKGRRRLWGRLVVFAGLTNLCLHEESFAIEVRNQTGGKRKKVMDSHGVSKGRLGGGRWPELEHATEA